MLWTHSKQGGYFELDMNDQVVLDVSIESVGKIIVCVCVETIQDRLQLMAGSCSGATFTL